MIADMKAPVGDHHSYSIYVCILPPSSNHFRTQPVTFYLCTVRSRDTSLAARRDQDERAVSSAGLSMMIEHKKRLLFWQTAPFTKRTPPAARAPSLLYFRSLQSSAVLSSSISTSTITHIRRCGYVVTPGSVNKLHSRRNR